LPVMVPNRPRIPGKPGWPRFRIFACGFCLLRSGHGCRLQPDRTFNSILILQYAISRSHCFRPCLEILGYCPQAVIVIPTSGILARLCRNVNAECGPPSTSISPKSRKNRASRHFAFFAPMYCLLRSGRGCCLRPNRTSTGYSVGGIEIPGRVS
jgi:hypothetical protein